jgi:branched-chain amino acid transport system permease protein
VQLTKRLALTAVVGLTIVLLAPLAAVAQTETTIGGTLIYQAADGERTPVEGVAVTVSQDGNEIGTGVSDAEGKWSVVIPGAGTYQVKLDESTLPEGVTLTDPTRVELPDVQVLGGQQKKVIFPLGEGTTRGVSGYQRLTALFVAGLKLGAIIALAAVGLSLIYGVTGLVNFSHAEMVTLGAVVAYFFHVSSLGPEWSLVLATVPAVLFVAAFGGLQEIGLWRPLRRRNTSLIAMMVVSIGLSFALRSVIQLMFGGEPRAYLDFAGQASTSFLGVPIVPKHAITAVAAVVVLGAVGLFLQRTKTGTAMRAVSDDPDLAESSGIDVNRVILFTWILAGGLAGLAGVFFGINDSVTYDMGFKLLLLIFAAVILGGLGTAYGAMVGGFIVGVAVEMSTLFVPSELKAAVGLFILIVMLLVRPQGILGTKERIG